MVMHTTEYVQYDAVGLADLVRKGEVTARELAGAASEAMEAVNGRLNAVIERIEQETSSITARGGGSLFGVPFLLKNLGHRWAGLPCDMGSRLGSGYRYCEDGPFAARLRSSGLVPVGVTNSSEFGINAVTEPVVHGATRNPWNPALSPGGSSGGSAAAVAAGIVPIAHASDGGGSIRVPAAWCGLVGLKPSRGRNPLSSLTASDAGHWITCQNVISRTVRDTAVALDATCGPVPGDYVPQVKPKRPFLEEVSRDPGHLRIALCTQLRDAGAPDPECIAAAVSAARLCESLGHDIDVVTPDIAYPDMAGVCFDLFVPGLVEAVHATSAATGLDPGPDTLEKQTLASFAKGSAMTAANLKSRLGELAAMSRCMGTLMLDFDVMITPAVSRMACPVGKFSSERQDVGDLTFWDDEMDYYTFAPLFSITGQPAITLPLHWTAGDLPVGVQFAAAIGEDAVLFRLAGQLEAARPWAQKYPAVHAAREQASARKNS